MSNDESFLDKQVDAVDHEGEQEEPFNFEEHRNIAVEEYRRVRRERNPGAGIKDK
ncbi:MAG: hypothetical protein J4G01_08690 [Dehalococcoidia bacterium]|nr:hypothetical protein [Dehalococcoidia bacterium]